MLHVITPHHPTTSASIQSLMRRTIRQLPSEEHHVIAIGCEQDVKQLRHQGIPVLGSVDGQLDASKTLRKRVMKYVESSQLGSYQNILAWGWHATAVVSDCAGLHDVYALIDEVGREQICKGDQAIIATSNISMRKAIKLGYSSVQFTEPLIGVDPIPMTVDISVVHDSLNISQEESIVSIVGDIGSWQVIIRMAVQLRVAKIQAVFVLPTSYRDHAQLIRAAKNNGVLDMVLDTPTTLRAVDVLRSSECAWSPAPAEFDDSCNVLDVLTASLESIPLAVQSTHPVATIPTIGPKIAWAKDEIEVFGWMVNILKGSKQFETQLHDRVSMVRAITAPTKFIEGLQARMHSLV